ncbi:MAG: NAD(P)H-dependent oxidoreductase [Pseudomonadales bacterium]|nr:NAD(P)H-dependent oxidoreductase [Pseudomonadales bacterium]
MKNTQLDQSITNQNIVVFSGSLKKASWNQKLVQIAGEMAASLGANVTEISLRDYPLPLFNEEIEHEDHAGLSDLRAVFSRADGMIIASPEYNGSITPALKNAIDWISRPSSEQNYTPNYAQQKAAIIATSPGGLGGLRGLTHLREILSNLGTHVIPAQLAVPTAYEAFNESGDLSNAATKDRLQAIVEQFLKLSLN